MTLLNTTCKYIFKQFVLIAIPVLFICCGEKKPQNGNANIYIIKPHTPSRQMILNKARVLSSIAFDNFQNGLFKKALDSYQSAISNLTLIDNHLEIGRVYNNIGSVYLKTGKVNKAREWLTKAYKTGKRFNDIALQSEALNNIGLSWEIKNDYSKALGNYRKIIRLVPPQRKYFHILSKQFNNVGYLLYLGKKYRPAIQHFIRSINFNKRNTDLNILAESYTYLGECYLNLKQTKLSLVYFVNALKTDKLNENPLGIAANLKNIGRVYLFMDKADQAVQYFERAVKINVQLKRYRRVIRDLEYLIEATKKTGDTKKLTEYNDFLIKMKKAAKK